MSIDNRLHTWISEQNHFALTDTDHSFIPPFDSPAIRADSPLLGFPDNQQFKHSDDPLLFPSPTYSRYLPDDDDCDTHSAADSVEPLEFLTAMSQASWSDRDKPLPPPPSSSQRRPSIPPPPPPPTPTQQLSRPQSKESLCPNSRSNNPRLTRLPSFSSILSTLQDNIQNDRDNAPTPTPLSLSPTTTAFSVSSCSSPPDSRCSPYTTAPNSPVTPFYSLSQSAACSQVYLGKEELRVGSPSPLTPLAFSSPQEATQSRWSLATSLDDDFTEPKRPKSLKLGGKKGSKRRRLASFLSAKFGSSGEDVPPLPMSSQDAFSVVSSSEDEHEPAPERLRLDLGPSRLSIPPETPIQLSLSITAPPTHVKSRSVATTNSDFSVVPARDDTLYVPRSRNKSYPTSQSSLLSPGNDYDLFTHPSPSPTASTFSGLVPGLHPPFDHPATPRTHSHSMSEGSYPSSPQSSVFPSSTESKVSSLPFPSLPTKSKPSMVLHSHWNTSPGLMRPKRSSMAAERKKERAKSPSSKSMKMTKRERIVSFMSRLGKGGLVEPMPEPYRQIQEAGGGGDVEGLGRGRTLRVSKSKVKRKLVVSGVAPDDVGGYEAVKMWCESFGKVRTISRKPNGNLEVDWCNSNVADTVCRLQAQVSIKGAGSVGLSWSSEKCKLGISL